MNAIRLGHSEAFALSHDSRQSLVKKIIESLPQVGEHLTSEQDICKFFQQPWQALRGRG